MDSHRQRTFLPQILAILYGLAIAYASLQPFVPWIPPPPAAPFWPFAPWPPKWTRFDVIANALAYTPFGLFVALVPRRAAPLVRTGVALAAGVTLSFAMETLQMFLPSRSANLVDLFANAGGAIVGGVAGGALVRAQRTRRWLSAARYRAFLPGRLGDVGIALLALWLTAQINPGIPLFAVNFDPGLHGCRGRASGHRGDDARRRAIGIPACRASACSLRCCSAIAATSAARCCC